ncbi:LAGLIDADG family homing endonuclease [Patescibacteria group bacterium]|nr:LAGLIDADG family homing endonuclease [Patescibacteria group bacterium]MBU4367767.1 LAGLIDADG family homing endonuclease [Patescibacteria group bacterium]MBU4461457.1 LAGLIDADG family homing endonuclease [Patescibacteria group bacterium]MCG2700411.1 LAGLIDADG family homing endonuclease [Candidatus Parcubacteria bacterium]
MLSADYIVGITDGEGSFTVYPRPPGGSRGGKSYKMECHYYLKLQEDDLIILKKIKEFFGCGTIYFQRDKRENHTDCYRYEINHFSQSINFRLKARKKILIYFAGYLKWFENRNILLKKDLRRLWN